ncbi:MAG TPA: 30S ribosomal protein S9 [Anaerolineae bacterium]|nr:30S ribosomal protein S9 [Anaerolineae bacterium]HOQ99441.1 30S ribosomal protein S9 [Anaerolineae bacterium]HPL27746.1 30S ribosomal protein S9 [Anaerolineae bacterium]
MAVRYYYGTGRRKEAVAQVRLYPGTGSIVVNGKPAEQYFSREVDLFEARGPLQATGMAERFSIMVRVVGGGVTGQASAVQHGIARALLEADPELRLVLRKGGFLTRDSRIKERKKPGLKRARKAPQYTKR